jgi:hypothetical protein
VDVRDGVTVKLDVAENVFVGFGIVAVRVAVKDPVHAQVMVGVAEELAVVVLLALSV